MKRLLIILVLFLNSLISFAGPVETLIENGFACEDLVVNGCSMKSCLGKISGYSQEVLALVPEKTHNLRVHFHGHKLFIIKEFDISLNSMVKALGLEERICRNTELAIFPSSRGNCADYDKELATVTQQAHFLESLESLTGLATEQLHFSAHSGGGRALVRYLANFPQLIVKASFYDAMYNTWQPPAVIKYIKGHDVEVKLVTVNPGSPHNLSQKVFAKACGKSVPQLVTLNARTFTQYKSSECDFVYRRADPSTQESGLLAHYRVMTDTWD